MARDPTRFSRVSIGWVDSAQTLADVDASDTGPVFSVDGQFRLGLNGTDAIQVSSTTHAIDFGSISGQDVSTVTVGISDATRGDFINITMDSEWSGNDRWLYVNARSGDTTGEVSVDASNISSNAIDPASTVARITRIDFPDYI